MFRKFAYLQYVCGHFSTLYVIFLFFYLFNYHAKNIGQVSLKRTIFAKPNIVDVCLSPDIY